MDENSRYLPEDRIVIQETLTPAEITFEKWRKTLGLFIVLFLLNSNRTSSRKKEAFSNQGLYKGKEKEVGAMEKGPKKAAPYAFLLSLSF